MSEPLTIKVKYHTDIDPLQQIKTGDAIDVRAAEDINLKYMESTRIPLGFSCELPNGYFALLMPRSSTFEKYGIIQTNSIGCIDSTFCGNDDRWALPVIALRADVHIPKNERIAQFLVVPKSPVMSFTVVDDLGNDNRGGFGSSGRINFE